MWPWFFLYFRLMIFQLFSQQNFFIIIVILFVWYNATESSSFTNFTNFWWHSDEIRWTYDNSSFFIFVIYFRFWSLRSIWIGLFVFKLSKLFSRSKGNIMPGFYMTIFYHCSHCVISRSHSIRVTNSYITRFTNKSSIYCGTFFSFSSKEISRFSNRLSVFFIFCWMRFFTIIIGFSNGVGSWLWKQTKSRSIKIR